MIHELKTINPYFDLIRQGIKNFEVSKNDRDFKRGDEVELKEWNPETKDYSGRMIKAMIGYVLEAGEFGIQEGYCVFSLLYIEKY